MSLWCRLGEKIARGASALPSEWASVRQPPGASMPSGNGGQSATALAEGTSFGNAASPHAPHLERGERGTRLSRAQHGAQASPLGNLSSFALRVQHLFLQAKIPIFLVPEALSARAVPPPLSSLCRQKVAGQPQRPQGTHPNPHPICWVPEKC